MQNAAVGQATTPAQSTGWPSVTHPALNNAPAVKSTVDLPTWEELTDIRYTLNTAIDKELSRTTSDALFLALRRVKADLNADINTRLEQSAGSFSARRMRFYPRWCWRRPGLITRRVTRTLSGVMPLRIPALCR